jgi:uncharacterized protein
MATSKKSQNIIAIVLLAVIIVVVMVYFLKECNHKPMRVNPVVKEQTEKISEPAFRKDGELTFLSGTNKLKTISMEIAQTEETRSQGLMYRKSMPDSCGMLFVFDQMQTLSFWMKNTIMPLDIIFIDDEFRIITIAKNTTPFSEKSIPSTSNGMYVVEVNAGFTDKYHITEGNKITFTTK